MNTEERRIAPRRLVPHSVLSAHPAVLLFPGVHRGGGRRRGLPGQWGTCDGPAWSDPEFLEEGVGRLQQDKERLERQVERLQEEVDRVRRELEKALRAAERQAAPCARHAPKEHPRKPGRKAGSCYGGPHWRPVPAGARRQVLTYRFALSSRALVRPVVALLGLLPRPLARLVAGPPYPYQVMKPVVSE